MLVIVEFLDDFENIVRGTKASFDPEYNDSIENLKVMMTLKSTDLEVTTLRILNHGKILRDKDSLNNLNIKQGDVLQVRKRTVMGCNMF